MVRPLLILLLIISGSAFSAVISEEKRWSKGQEIIIEFVNGTAEQQALVKQTALQWTRYANLDFRFVPNGPKASHLRIAFSDYDGTKLGVQPLSTSDQANVLLASVARKDLSEGYKKRIILHEFGHILGFEHEYRHPDWPYGPAVIKRLETKCEANLPSAIAQTTTDCYELHKPLSRHDHLVLAFDRHSIMQYPTELKLLEGTINAIPVIMQLSPLDQTAAAIAYPNSPDGDSGLVFRNHCHLPVTIYWRSQSDKGSIRLEPYATSHALPMRPQQLFWRAVSTPAIHRWNNSTNANNLLPLPTKAWQNNQLNVPTFCD